MDYQEYFEGRFSADDVSMLLHEWEVANGDLFSGDDAIVIDGEPEYDAGYKIWCVYAHDSKGQYRIGMDSDGKFHIEGI